MYDLIIIGGGPAAVSAGIYAARKKLKTILITKDWGGQVALAPEIENYPGFDSITGAELVKKFVEHLKKNELEIKEGVEIKDIKVNNNLVEVKANSDSYQAKAAIVTTGRNPRKLGLPNEAKFLGKGISYCSTCDAPLFKDKEVAVIGGGNMGLGTALDLVTYASKIYILEYDSKIRADQYFQEKVKKNDKIEVITSARIAEIKGDQFVSSLSYSNGTGGKNKELLVQGIFVAIGSDASSFLVKNVVELNKEGEIKIDSRNRTSQPNIFAAGDVTDISHKQIVIAAGEGAKAALNAYDYLQSLNQ